MLRSFPTRRSSDLSHLRAAWLRSARNEGATSATSWPPPRTTGSSPPRLTSRLRRPVGLHSPGRACDGLDFGSPRSRSEFRCAGLVQEGGVSCGIPRQGSELGAQRHLSVCLGRVCERLHLLEGLRQAVLVHLEATVTPEVQPRRSGGPEERGEAEASPPCPSKPTWRPAGGAGQTAVA